jgi:hypothetical protein
MAKAPPTVDLKGGGQTAALQRKRRRFLAA